MVVEVLGDTIVDVILGRWESRIIGIIYFIFVLGYDIDMVLGNVCSGRFKFRLMVEDEIIIFFYVYIWVY